MLLMIPGPIAVDQRVVAAMNRPAVNPHGTEFKSIIQDVFCQLKTIFQTEAWVTVLAGSGRTGLEAAIVSVIERGDRTVHIVNGSFGELLVTIASRAGAQTTVVNGRWGGPVDTAAVERKVAEVKPVLVTMVHSETSTGAVYRDLDKISEICHEHGALFMVDGISSIGTEPLNMDSSGLDLAVAASNKGLGALHGLAMVGVSQRACQALRERNSPCTSYSLDLKRWGDLYFDNAPGEQWLANPPPTHLIYALLEACRQTLEEGLGNRWERCKKYSMATRSAIEAAGLEIFPDQTLAASCVTAIKIPDGIDGKMLLRTMEENGVQIAGTVSRPSPITNLLWRISHQGVQASREMLLPTLAAFEQSLRICGFSIQPGVMLAAFESSLNQ